MGMILLRLWRSIRLLVGPRRLDGRVGRVLGIGECYPALKKPLSAEAVLTTLQMSISKFTDMMSFKPVGRLFIFRVEHLYSIPNALMEARAFRTGWEEHPLLSARCFAKAPCHCEETSQEGAGESEGSQSLSLSETKRQVREGEQSRPEIGNQF